MLPEVPRFIRWGKPVEELVRDHPGAILALAAMRPLRTVSTFSVWRTQREMTDMVRGRSSVPRAERHAVAMLERARRDFHFEFTTLRFRALAEHGVWEGRSNIVPSDLGRRAAGWAPPDGRRRMGVVLPRPDRSDRRIDRGCTELSQDANGFDRKVAAR